MKRVADPDNANKVKISDDGSKVTSDGLEAKPNPFDEYAVETAIRILEDGVGSGKLRGEVLVATVGGDDVLRQVRQCLAMGADRGIMVAGDDEKLDSTIVANTLAALVKKEGIDLVVIGKQAVDGDSNQTAQALAQILGWPQATFAGHVEVPEDLSHAIVTREVDGGAAKIKVAFPAVISVDLRVVTPAGVNNNVATGKEYQEGPRYASLKGIMKAKKKPIDKYTLDDLGIDQTLKVRTVGYTAPPQRSAGIIVETVEELITRLHDEARVL
jgi:electron transfer flavoprotein beta subunit